MKKERIIWIDYVKLFASIMIMTAHLQDAAIDFCQTPPASSAVYDAVNGFLLPLQTGKFWVMVFCILSGFLGSKKISSFRELTTEAVFRYLRFLLPLLLCNSWTLWLFKTNRLYHAAYGSLFRNDWLANHYTAPFGFADVIRESLILGERFNGTLWMLLPLFAGNLFILGVRYLTRNMSEKKQLWAEFSVLLGLIGLSTQSLSVLYATATFSGVLFYDTRRTLFSAKLIVPVLMGIWAILYLPMPWISSPYCYLVLAALLVGVFLYSGYSPRGITGVNPSAVSFWVFLLHWPVICSTSTRILLRYADRFWLGFWLSMSVTVFGVLAASLVLSKTFDVWVNRWLKTLKAKISGVASGVHS